MPFVSFDEEDKGSGFIDFDKPVTPAPAKPDQGDFMRGAKETFQQIPQLGYGLLAGAGAAMESAVGEGGIATGFKKAGVKGYQDWGNKIASDSKPSDSFSVAYDEAKQGNFGAMVDWLQHGLGYAAGQGVQMLATAGVGSLVGKAALKGAAEKIASGLVSKEAARIAATEEGARLGADALTKIATSNVASKIGQTVAIGANAFGQEGGEIFGDLSEKSVNENRALSGAELAKAFGATLAAGGLEFVGDKIGLDVMLGKSALVKPAAGMAGMRGRLARGALAGAAEAPIEGATEYGQTLLEEYGKGNDPFSADSLKQAKDAAALGALAGGGMGGVGGMVHGAQHTQVAPLQLTNKPDPLLSFPDGSVGRQSDADAFIASLPEPDRNAARARLFGYESQPVTPEDVMRSQSLGEAIAVANRAIEEGTPEFKAQKEADIDAAWGQYLGDRTNERQQGYDAAEQARRDADMPAMAAQAQDQAVAQANALTSAQGFDEQQPTALQLAFQKAQASRQDRLAEAQQRATVQDQQQNIGEQNGRQADTGSESEVAVTAVDGGGGASGRRNETAGAGLQPDAGIPAARASTADAGGSGPVRNEGLRGIDSVHPGTAEDERALDGSSGEKREVSAGLPSTQANGPQPAVIEKQAKAILTAAGVTGNERMEALRNIRSGVNTLEDLIDAHPPKAKEAANESGVRPAVRDDGLGRDEAAAPAQPSAAPAGQVVAEPNRGPAPDAAASIRPSGEGVADAVAPTANSPLDEIKQQNERPFAKRESTGARADFASVEKQQTRLEAEIEKAKTNAVARKSRETVINELGLMTSGELRKQSTKEKRAYVKTAIAEILAERDSVTRGKRSDAAKRLFAKSKNIDPDRDTMSQAIARMGGINRDSAAGRMRLAPEELRTRSGIQPLFTGKGMTMESMGAALAELGYVQRDENGKYNQSDFEEKLADVAGGAEVYTPNGMMTRAQEQYESAQQQVGAESASEYHDVEQYADQADEQMQREIDAAFDAAPTQEELSDEQIDAIFGISAEAQGGRVSEINPASAKSESGGGNQAQTGEEFGLTGETAEEARAAISQREASQRQAAAELQSKDESDRRDREKRDIQSRQDASAENFQLGKSAEDGLSGQEGLFSKRRGSSAGMTAAAVSKAIVRLRAKWIGSVKVNIVQSVGDLPADVRERSQADDKTEGLYDPKTGQVYLVADNISDPARAAWVAAHEQIGHGGLRALKDKTVNEALNLAGANKFIKDLSTAIATDRGTVNDSLTVEEAVAEMAAAIETDGFQSLKNRYGVEVPPSARNGLRGTIARVLEAVKRFLATAIGKPVSSVSDADVRELIGAQREAVSQGGATEDAPGSGRIEPVMQSRAPVAGGEEVTPKWAESLSPELKTALRKSGVIHTEKTMKQKIAELKEGAIKKLQYGILDQFAPIKDQIGKIPYILARMAKNADGTLEAMMHYGRPYVDADGGMHVDTTKKGFIETMQALNGEHDQFFSWLAGRRAEQLKKEGRENLFTDGDISALSTLNQGTMKDGSSREAVYLRAQKDVAELNKSVLDIAEAAGLIDSASRKVWQSDFYVPFYRVMEEGITGPSIKSGLVNQKSIKKLRGGTNNLGDLTQNMLMNWSTLLTASAKNRAAKATLDGATAIGAAVESDETTIRQMAKSAQSKAVSYMEDGKYRWFTVEDEHLLAAVAALDFSGYNNQAMKAMGAFKNYLTMAVTASPLFKVRNLIRDSISVIAVSDVGYNPLANVKNGFSLLRNDDFRAQMVAGGGMYRFGTLMEGNRGEHVKNLIDAGVADDTILDTSDKMRAFVQKLWDGYQEIGDLGENVNRATLYEKLRKEGKSHLEASFEARDLMDFGLSGAWAGVRALNQILPFFNARLQGLYKLGRGYNDDPKRMGTVIGAVALASVALMLAYKDDDDFKKRSDADRNNYWWFKVGDTAFRIPKPFEIGAAGSAIEHFTALMLDSENTNAKRFANQLGDIVNSQLAMNPIPQIFRPLIDVYANKDAFTGRPIENMAMQRLRPEDRYTYNTSELARLLSKSGMLVDPVSLVSGTGVKQLSPVQIDSMIRGYFSGVGSLATAAVDGLLHHTVIDHGAALPVTVKTFAGSFAETLPSNSSRYVDMLYSTAQDIEQSYASYQNAIKSGDLEKARSIAADNKEELAKYHMVESLKRNESKITQQIQRVTNSKELTGEQKDDAIKRLRKAQDQIARQFATRQ